MDEREEQEILILPEKVYDWKKYWEASKETEE